MKIKELLRISLLGVGLAHAANASADDKTWTPPTGDFLNPANWQGGLPGVGDGAFIENDGTATIGATAGTIHAATIRLGTSGANSGHVIMNGGTLIIAENPGDPKPIIGNGTVQSSFIMNGGTIYLDGPDTGAQSTSFKGLTELDWEVGEKGLGRFEMHGGSFFASDDLKGSDSGGGTSEMIFDGNAHLAVGSGVSVSGGAGSKSTMTIGGNALVESGNSMGAGNPLGGTDEGYLTMASGGGISSLTIKDSGVFNFRRLSAREGESTIVIKDHGQMHIFDVLTGAGTNAATRPAVTGPNSSFVSAGQGTFTLQDDAVLTVNSAPDSGPTQGLAIAGRRDNNSPGGTATFTIRDRASFRVEQDLNIGTGYNPDLTDGTFEIIGPDAKISIAGNLDLAVDNEGTPTGVDADGNPKAGKATVAEVISGPAQATINVAGTARIAHGILKVKLNGYNPASGTSYALIKGGTIDGQFASTDFTDAKLAAGLNWEVEYKPDAVNLKVTGQATGPRTLTVTTTNNENPPAGTLSLNQALSQLQDGDTIKFNIPGDGPQTIVTPVGGYPLITANNVTIDGYSQPGATPNSNPILGGNNAKIKIVLDSSDAASAPSRDSSNSLLLERRSTRLPFSGYGDTENAIIGVLGGDNFSIRGISFLGRRTQPSTGADGDEDAGDTSLSDPAIYAVALIQEAKNAKVQGCWFGLAPDGTTVKPVNDAVAAFRHRQPTDTYSAGLVFGTDGDGVNDVAEFNIAIGCRIAIAIELPNARISGNYFNVFPNGTTFYDLEAAAAELNTLGFSSQTLENIENGRVTENTVIGTDGNGISDANERNIFAHALYEHDIEFYSSAPNAVVAGNYFGVGVDGTTVQQAFTSASPDFISLPGTASVRIGSNGDGVSDDLEANLLYNFPGSRFVDAGAAVPIVARRNKMAGNSFDGFPFAEGQNNRQFDAYYAPVLVDSSAGVLPVITSIKDGIMSGTLPAPNKTDYPAHIVDVYTIDTVAEQNGKILPGNYVTSFVEGSAADTDPAPNSFKFSLIGSSVAPGTKVAIAVTYSKSPTNFAGTNALTGPLSTAVEADIPAYAPGSIESVGLKRTVSDSLVVPVTADALGNWEPYVSVLGNTDFLIEANTFAGDSDQTQRYVVALQPVAGGAAKAVEGFYSDDGRGYTNQINGSRPNGNPGRVAGDKRPGALNYVVGGEASPHAVPAFQSDNRWSLGFDRLGGPTLDADPKAGEGRYGVVQGFHLDPQTLIPTPLFKAIDAANGRLTTGTAPALEITRFGGDLAALDNGNFVVLVEDRSNVRVQAHAAVAVILAADGTIVKDSFVIGTGDIWSNLAAFKGGFAVRLAGVIYFYDNAGNLQGQVDQNTSGESFDRGRGDGTRIAGHINSPYVFLAGKVSNDNVVKLAAWDSRDRTFVAKADVSEGAFTGGFDRANLAVDALNRIVVGWVSQPDGYEAQQVAARVMELNPTTKTITALTKSFLPFINAAKTGGIRSVGMSLAMTTKQILVAAKGEINLQNQPQSGANSAKEVNFYTVFTHPAPAEDPTPGIGGGNQPTLAISKSGGTTLQLSWIGGKAPFTVQKKNSLSDAQWTTVSTTSQNSITVQADGKAGFFRVQSSQ